MRDGRWGREMGDGGREMGDGRWGREKGMMRSEMMRDSAETCVELSCKIFTSILKFQK
jgi:hypothetical protein